MELIEVEILGQVITAQYGTLSTGDILRTDAAFAAHLVDDCSAAKYTQAKVAPAEPAPAEPALVEPASAEPAPAEPPKRAKALKEK